MVLPPVKHAEDDHPVADDLVEDLVREAAEDDPTKIPVLQTGSFGIGGEDPQRHRNLVEKRVAQSGSLGVVPVTRGGQIALRFRGTEPKTSGRAEGVRLWGLN